MALKLGSHLKAYSDSSVISGWPNNVLQPTYLPPLRYGKSAAEPGRWAPRDQSEER